MSDEDLSRTTWKYAVTREVINGEAFYTVREVYSSRDGRLGWTENPIAPSGNNWIECCDDLAIMGRVVGSPVLDISCDPPEWRTPFECKRLDRQVS